MNNDFDGPASNKALNWALGIAVVTFVIKFGSIRSSSVNGVMTSCAYVDFFALIVGASLLLFGVVRAFKSKDEFGVLVYALLIAALGALHVARGLGMVMSPCG